MFKKLLPYFLVLGVIALIIVAFSLKGKLNNFISEKMQQQVSVENSSSAKEIIQRKYNYLTNGEDFDFTFLEFSSTECAICKQMESVLEEVKQSERVNVNVVFLHIMNSDNLELMKYYGISAVPMQILLDKQGNEFFRHYGFISARALEEKFLQNKTARNS